MSDISQVLNMDIKNGLLFIAALIVAIIWVIQKFDFIMGRFGVKTKNVLREEKQEKELETLKARSEKQDENIERIIESIERVKESVSSVSEQVKDMQERNNAAERSRLKDRIGQSYRYYVEKGEWSMMEKDAFDDLVKSYEDAGGENSFVHTICMPTSLTWKIVDK